jgi:hypothetical protein
MGEHSVLYRCDGTGEGLFKFVANRGIRGQGQLFIAHWEPGGRVAAATEGRGIWVAVPKSALDDPARKLRELFGPEEYDRHFATELPSGIEVADDGCVWISVAGALRCLRERGTDPEALAFSWRDYAPRSSSRSASARSRKRSTEASLISS